ncbi:hypothetical protein GMOD_00004095 [Pyrenophora seminiperda CCB06]|uniref:Uncharacterized protein n=1 Tax=Pyrenophora seminiperda CCB06 TaxID=1302712 RepID=A0A3M7M0M8_9PLEO|nr:hypothetical protein GMOD_00004095 [Pyrenophora seminiperda CCB06]
MTRLQQQAEVRLYSIVISDEASLAPSLFSRQTVLCSKAVFTVFVLYKSEYKCRDGLLFPRISSVACGRWKLRP